MQPRHSKPVFLPELTVSEHGVLVHLGLVPSDIRVNRDGSLSCVRKSGGIRVHSYRSNVRTNLGNAVVFTLTPSSDGSANLVGTVDTLLFALALARVYVESSSVFLDTNNTIVLTILCDTRDIPILKYEVDYAAQHGCLVPFAPIRVEQKRMSKVCSLGHFPSAFLAAVAAALASKMHLDDHWLSAMHMRSIPMNSLPRVLGDGGCGLSHKIRAMLHHAQQASLREYIDFWSFMNIDEN